MEKRWTVRELTRADAIKWLRKPCWSKGEALMLLNDFLVEGVNTVAYPPAPNAGNDTDALKRAIDAGHLPKVGTDENGEPVFVPRDIIQVAKDNDIGNWRAWDYLLFPHELREEIASQSHWGERELEALCQGVPPDIYSDIVTPENEWGPIRNAIREACKSGQLHAEQSGNGNALYGGQWRIERVSAIRWVIATHFPWFPKWLATNALKEIGIRQDAERRAAGRYTLREAAEEIASNAGERIEPLLTKLTRAALNGSLPVYHPGGMQRYEYGKAPGQALDVSEFYEEAYWNNLNDWLVANEPRIYEKWRFPEPKSATVAQMETSPAATETHSDWIAKALAITNEIALKRWKNKHREITGRNICDDVADELGKDKSTWGKRGPRSASNIRTFALKGWKFTPPQAA